MGIPEGDKILVLKINKLKAEISKLRTDLYLNPRPGCACNGKSICAHHAEVYNSLDAAFDRLSMAAAQAGRDE